MKKTIKEWLEELPEGYRERALANCTLPDAIAETMYKSLMSGFRFRKAPEGGEFWIGVCSHYRKGTPLPPLPSLPTE